MTSQNTARRARVATLPALALVRPGRLFRTAPGVLRRYNPENWERLELQVYSDVQRVRTLRDAGRITAAAYDRYWRNIVDLLELLNWGADTARADASQGAA